MGDKIRAEFQFHALNDKGASECNAIRAAFSTLLDVVASKLGPSREGSLVVTKLQEASLCALEEDGVHGHGQISSAGRSAMQPRITLSGISPAVPTRRIAAATSAPESTISPPDQSSVWVHAVAASTTP